MNRIEVLKWCVEELIVWPSKHDELLVPPKGWGWNNTAVGFVLEPSDLEGNTHCTITKSDWLATSDSPVSAYVEMTGGKKSALDEQVGGDHYKKLGEFQPWSVLHKWLTPEELKGFMKGTVISYLQREADKGQREGIRKAHHTMSLYLELTENDE